MVNLDPEVDSRFAWKSRFPRALCFWQSLPAVLMRPVYEGFWNNFIFLREGGLSAWLALGNLNIMSNSSSYDVVDCFSK